MNSKKKIKMQDQYSAMNCLCTQLTDSKVADIASNEPLNFCLSDHLKVHIVEIRAVFVSNLCAC